MKALEKLLSTPRVALTDYVGTDNFADQVQEFLQNKMDLNMRGELGETLLHLAARLDKRCKTQNKSENV